MKRRDFIVKVAAAGGSTYAALEALGMLPDATLAQTGPVRLVAPRNRPQVLILGAGVAGLAAAYELGKVGYECTILEARSRSGGRCFTLRYGSIVEEVSAPINTSRGIVNSTPQSNIAYFSDDQYFNCGPARIPQHHTTLDYCRELGVALEVFANLNRQQYYFNESGANINIAGVTAPVGGRLAGRKIRARAAIADMRGYVAELLAKSVDRGMLNDELSATDRERLIDYLRSFGDLGDRSQGFRYSGTSRRGWSNLLLDGRILDQAPGAGARDGNSGTPYPLEDLLALRFANYETFESSSEQQMLMFQPVGGIDAIPRAFERQPMVGPRIRYNTEVLEIRKIPNGVRIVTNGGIFEGVYCICTIPLPVLRILTTTGKTDFDTEMQQAIDWGGQRYIQTGKVGLEFSRRFWEEDDDIFGGITSCRFSSPVLGQSFIAQPATFWYPSSGYATNRGVIVSAYNFGTDAGNYTILDNRTRVMSTLAQGVKVHPQYGTTPVYGISAYWSAIPYSLGGWGPFPTSYPPKFYDRLNAPDGNIWLCGEHLSYLTGWIAGSLESAKKVVREINDRDRL